MLGWMNHKIESRLLGKISVPSQIGCEPEPALKNKITIKRKRQTSGKKPT